MKKYAVIMTQDDALNFWPINYDESIDKCDVFCDDTLLNQTLEKIHKIIPMSNIFIFVNHKYKEHIYKTVNSSFILDNIIIEPHPMNNTAAVGYLGLYLKILKGDGTIAFFPSNRILPDNSSFLKGLINGYRIAEIHSKTIAFGLKPIYASRKYLYVKRDNTASNNIKHSFVPNSVLSHVNYTKASELITDSDLFWCSSVIIWHSESIEDYYKNFFPEIHEKLDSLSQFIGYKHKRNDLLNIYTSISRSDLNESQLIQSDDLLFIDINFDY